MIDKNGDGKLSKNEFERAMQIMEIKITTGEIDDLFLFIDLDGYIKFLTKDLEKLIIRNSSEDSREVESWLERRKKNSSSPFTKQLRTQA